MSKERKVLEDILATYRSGEDMSDVLNRADLYMNPRPPTVQELMTALGTLDYYEVHGRSQLRRCAVDLRALWGALHGDSPDVWNIYSILHDLVNILDGSHMVDGNPAFIAAKNALAEAGQPHPRLSMFDILGES